MLDLINLPPDPGWDSAPAPEPEPESEPESEPRVYQSSVGPVKLSDHDDPVQIKQRRKKA